jgi:hypothetical protein
MIVVAEQERRRQQRPGRNLLGDVCRREIAQVEVVALKRDQLGALLEERVAPVRLEIEIVLDRSGERLVGLGAQVGLGEGTAEAELLPGLCAGAPGSERKNGAPPATTERRVRLVMGFLQGVVVACILALAWTLSIVKTASIL